MPWIKLLLFFLITVVVGFLAVTGQATPLAPPLEALLAGLLIWALGMAIGGLPAGIHYLATRRWPRWFFPMAVMGALGGLGAIFYASSPDPETLGLSGGMERSSGIDPAAVTPEEAAERLAGRGSQHLPQRFSVDADNRVTHHTTRAEDETVTLVMSFDTLRRDEVNRGRLQASLEDVLEAAICEYSEPDAAIRLGVRLVYLFGDADGEPLAAVRIAPDDCD